MATIIETERHSDGRSFVFRLNGEPDESQWRNSPPYIIRDEGDIQPIEVERFGRHAMRVEFPMALAGQERVCA